MKALEDTMPWTTFANEVRARREFITPTRFVPRRGTGELFEQTTYQYVGVNEQGKDLARKKTKPGEEPGKDIVMGNAVVSEDEKSIVKVSEMLCLRLWHDPEAKKGKGCWYADPIYKADIPALKNGTYVPRIAKAHTGRKTWKPIPSSALQNGAVNVYLDDLVQVGDFIGRFSGFNINSANWSFIDKLTRQPLKCPTTASLNNKMPPIVVREAIVS